MRPIPAIKAIGKFGQVRLSVFWEASMVRGNHSPLHIGMNPVDALQVFFGYFRLLCKGHLVHLVPFLFSGLKGSSGIGLELTAFGDAFLNAGKNIFFE